MNAAAPERVFFFRPMPSDDELLRRALTKTDEEMREELLACIEELERRLLEGGTPGQLEARRQELAAAERALTRLKERARK